MSKVKYYGMYLVAISVIFIGIREFDNAHHWMPFVRGLFWMVVGSVALWNTNYDKNSDS